MELMEDFNKVQTNPAALSAVAFQQGPCSMTMMDNDESNVALCFPTWGYFGPRLLMTIV